MIIRMKGVESCHDYCNEEQREACKAIGEYLHCWDDNRKCTLEDDYEG